jgi:hypothetical protein
VWLGEPHEVFQRRESFFRCQLGIQRFDPKAHLRVLRQIQRLGRFQDAVFEGRGGRLGNNVTPPRSFYSIWRPHSSKDANSLRVIRKPSATFQCSFFVNEAYHA